MLLFLPGVFHSLLRRSRFVSEKRKLTNIHRFIYQWKFVWYFQQIKDVSSVLPTRMQCKGMLSFNINFQRNDIAYLPCLVELHVA